MNSTLQCSHITSKKPEWYLYYSWLATPFTMSCVIWTVYNVMSVSKAIKIDCARLFERQATTINLENYLIIEMFLVWKTVPPLWSAFAHSWKAPFSTLHQRWSNTGPKASIEWHVSSHIFWIEGHIQAKLPVAFYNRYLCGLNYGVRGLNDCLRYTLLITIGNWNRWGFLIGQLAVLIKLANKYYFRLFDMSLVLRNPLVTLSIIRGCEILRLTFR